MAFTKIPYQQPPYGGIQAAELNTGKTLWTAKLPAAGHATPIVYSVDGREYVAIMAAGDQFMETPEGNSLVVYALPKLGRSRPGLASRREARRTRGRTKRVTTSAWLA